ncbi:MAG: HIRAN domain-containing protein [Clostridia bacterium]|nr:HIRAN domain-containing protein [Clostridia bacterium]
MKTTQKKTTINLQFIGKLNSRVVGCQYYTSHAKPGEILNFDRDPGNEFDGNAIEARNSQGEVLGHLPRHHSVFLAPLIDEGSVFLKGTAGRETTHNTIELELEVYLTHKGQAILDPVLRDNDRQIVHAIVTKFFRDCNQFSSATVLKMADRFKTLTRDNVLPQSILLSRLLHWKAHELMGSETRQFHQQIVEYLKSLRTATCLAYSNLEIMPLFSDNLNNGEYILLKDALAGGTLVVTEVSETGTVPRLKVNNRDTKPVLVLAGEELVGAKQNRIVNITIIIPPLAEVIIPVSCVEQSRWAYRSDKFAAGRQANATLRGKLFRTVRRSVRETGEYDSDQGMVWAEVARMHCCLGTSSDTGAMNDAYAGVDEKLGGFIENIKFPPGASGMAVFINGKLTAVETFSSPAILEKLWSSKVESFGVDAIMAGEKKASVGKIPKPLDKQ